MESNKVFQDFIKATIRINDERIGHIIESHPEMKKYVKEIIETKNLISYVKKTNGDGFIILSHPISNKRLSRAIKKWKLLKK